MPSIAETTETNQKADKNKYMEQPKRYQGDGANEEPTHGQVVAVPQKRWFTFSICLDGAQAILFILALATRFWRLGYPRSIVFDEILFGRFSLFYLKNIFFFDLNPPLGNQVYALLGQYFGLGECKDFVFDQIGKAYPGEFPIWQLRAIPALCGSLLVPMTYQLIIELGLSQGAAVFAGCLIIFENSLLVQSRFILLEPLILLACCIALVGLLKFRNLSHREFSIEWWCWLAVSGISAMCAFSIKYVGGFTYLLVIIVMATDYWSVLANRALSFVDLLRHLLARVLCLVVLPVAVYFLVLYVHLSTLTKAGPGNNMMTSAFQTSLEGGLALITKNQPYEIAYGSQITLRRTYGNSPCWLHSHDFVYPVKYADGRGSSHQQQVTCYIFKDTNNWWVVKHPDSEKLTVDVPPKPVKSGDIIEVVHGITGRKLNSHDVTGPVSKTKMEVSCYINYNVSMPPQTLWKVEILNPVDGDTWKTVRNNVKLVHVGTSAVLMTHDTPLPAWGFHQKEVVTDKSGGGSQAAVWNVEEHRYGQNEEIASALKKIDFVPTEPSQMSVWRKMWEFQVKLFSSNMDANLDHKYKTSPLDWPFMDRNIAYWLDKSSNAQIHLIGNPVIWYTGTFAVLFYGAFLVFTLLRRRRKCYDISQDAWNRFLNIGKVLVMGYLLHYVPYFLMERTLFMHSYLPALFYQVLVLAATVDILFTLISNPQLRRMFVMTLLVWSAGVLYSFYKISVLTYGTTALTRQEIEDMSWKETWDFLVHG